MGLFNYCLHFGARK